MNRPTIEINVVGTAGVGKSSIVLLLNDFLEHSGFSTEINLLDGEHMSDDVLASMIMSMPDRLDAMIDRDTHIVINEVQAKRESFK